MRPFFNDVFASMISKIVHEGIVRALTHHGELLKQHKILKNYAV